jgi:hypothetical protein
MIYEALDRCDAAEPLYKRAADIYMTAHGPDHPDTAENLRKSAALMLKCGRGVKAAKIRARAESLRNGSL